jgi:general secretion pathway protein M
VTLKERWAAFSPRERYLLIAAAAMALVVVLWYSPLSRLGDLSFEAEDDTWVQVRKIENYHRILGGADSAARRRDVLEQRYRQAQGRLVAGSTPTQVGAELQGRLSSLANDAQLQVLSSQILKEEEVEGFRRVGVRLTLSGTLEGVARLVSSVETGDQDLAVTLLEINRKLGASRRPTPSRVTSAAAASPLTATMEVKTFMQDPT